MAIGLGEGSEIRTPMAITVIFGLLFASFLTLLLIPVLYSLFDRKNFEHKSADEKQVQHINVSHNEEPSNG
jgi:HAE1 family hydrophobic/amphiphilic exporter-1